MYLKCKNSCIYIYIYIYIKPPISIFCWIVLDHIFYHIGSDGIWFDQIGSHLTRSNQIGSDLIRSDEVGSGSDSIGSDLLLSYRIFTIFSERIRSDPIRWDRIGFDRRSSVWSDQIHIRYHPIVSNLVRSNWIWLDLIGSDPIWSDLIKNAI
jgi:hypothetical protein